MEAKQQDQESSSGKSRKGLSQIGIMAYQSSPQAESKQDEDAANASSMASSPSASSTVTSDEEEVEVEPMLLGACRRCHMYVMVLKQNPRCPRCNSNALMNLFQE